MEGYVGQRLLEMPAFAYMYDNDDFTTLPNLHWSIHMHGLLNNLFSEIHIIYNDCLQLICCVPHDIDAGGSCGGRPV